MLPSGACLKVEAKMIARGKSGCPHKQQPRVKRAAQARRPRPMGQKYPPAGWRRSAGSRRQETPLRQHEHQEIGQQDCEQDHDEYQGVDLPGEATRRRTPCMLLVSRSRKPPPGRRRWPSNALAPRKLRLIQEKESRTIRPGQRGIPGHARLADVQVRPIVRGGGGRVGVLPQLGLISSDRSLPTLQGEY